MFDNPGPVVACLVDLTDDERVGQLREDVAVDDVAWIVARPGAAGYDGIAPLSQDLLDAIGCVGLRQPRAVGERHLYRALPYLRHGPVRDVLVTEAQWLPPRALRELVTVCACAGVTLWLLSAGPLPEGHLGATSAIAGELTAWRAVESYWRARLAIVRPAAQRCPAIRDRWWAGNIAAVWSTLTPECPVHDGRIACLLNGARAALTAAARSPRQVRDALIAIDCDGSTTPAECWQLRDAGRDAFTPAQDSLGQLLAVEDQFHDVHANALTPDGGALTTPAGRVAPVPVEMRRALLRQRTHSIMCNGPDDWPLLTMFDNYVRASY